MDRKNHKAALKRLNHTCQFCGKPRLNSPGRRYNFHHASSQAYKRERLGKNLLLLCRRCHWVAHLLGGELFLLPGCVRRQNRRARFLGFGAFPNWQQQIFNLVCRSPFNVKTLSIGLMVTAVAAIEYIAPGMAKTALTYVWAYVISI